MKVFNSIICVMFLSLSLWAQENVFLDRAYWQANPTLDQVKADIEKGNDPVSRNKYMFDASSLAILDKADPAIIQYLVSLDGNGVDKITHDGRNYLLWAGYAGDLEVINWLIDEGSDVHFIDEHGYGLVTFTAIGGQTNPAIYDLYLSKGLSMDETNRDGANALLLASSRVTGLDDLSYFLDHGMKLKDVDNHGNNLFLYAVSKGNVAFLKELVDAGVDYKKENEDGENAVIIASQGARRHHNGIETFNYLNELDIDFTQKDKEGKTALHYASARNPKKEVLEYLIQQGINPNALDHEGNPAIFYAVANNNAPATEVLLPLEKDLRQENKNGETLMSYAIQGNNDKITAFLLEKEIDLNHKNKANESYLNVLFNHYNDRNKAYFEKYVQILSDKGVQPTVNSKDGNTILHTAVDKNNAYLVNKAIELTKEDINVANHKGLTPIQQATLQTKDLQILKTLIQAGADKTVKTEFDETVYQLAQENEALQGKDIEFLK
ncbi:ankyrin repeat domain-containing protein [Flavobacteriaceae bacterium Ap0902]|nr:ankyrin repeat domain-containing protein [Flavobacteriaceae bacterium Ap0902]